MPTRVHEIMIAHVRSFILAALAEVLVDPLTPAALADLLRPVESMDSSDISLGPGNGRSSPGGSFGHLGASVPAVVIEVSNSQKKKDLKTLARNYIIHTLGDVRLVIGIDIDYRRTRMRVVSVWRAERHYLPDGRLHLAVRAVVIDQVSLWSSSISILP